MRRHGASKHAPRLWLLPVCLGFAALVLVSPPPASAVPQMDVTFYGNVYWGTNQLSRADTNYTITVSKGTNVLASYALGDRDTDWYVLPTPFTFDTNMVGWAYPNDSLRFSVNGVGLPQSDYLLTNSPADDVRLDLHADLVSLSVQSAHGPVSPTGTTWYALGTEIDLSAPAVLTDAGGYRRRLSGFSGSGSVPATGAGPTLKITITNHSTITWQWGTDYRLALLEDPTYGGGVAAAPGGDAGYYDAGAAVSLSATPGSGYLLDRWSGDASGTHSNVTVYMMAPKTVAAHFARDADLDDMPDDWELLYFGSISASNAAPNADIDRDGAVNLHEQIAGTDPLDGTSYFHIAQLSSADEGQTALSWLSAVDRTYRILIAERVTGPWTQYPDASTTYAGTGGTLQVTVTGVSTPALFIRLEVER